jgi:hypothetical protein
MDYSFNENITFNLHGFYENIFIKLFAYLISKSIILHHFSFLI